MEYFVSLKGKNVFRVKENNQESKELSLTLAKKQGVPAPANLLLYRAMF